MSYSDPPQTPVVLPKTSSIIHPTLGGSSATSTIVMQKDSIEILQVENGYFIMPAVYEGEMRKPLAVFNDFYDLCNWMRGHFGEPEINAQS